MLGVLKKADKILESILKVFVVITCLAIAVVVTMRIIIRIPFLYVPMAWGEEVIAWFMAWMVMCSATLLFRNGEHFRVELLETRFGDKLAMRIVLLLISLLSTAFIAMLLFYSIKFMQIKPQYSSILMINKRFFYVCIPVNCVLSLFYLIRDVVVCSIRLKNPRFAKPAPELPQAETAKAVVQE